MIEGITAVVEVALLAAFVLVSGGFAVLLWDLLRERMRGWLRVMVVVVGAPACALVVTVISAAAGYALASALGPDEPPAQRSEPAKEDLERTSTERRGLRDDRRAAAGNALGGTFGFTHSLAHSLAHG